jgi:hypothetical protein
VDVNRAGRRTVACGLCSRRRKLPHVDFPAVMHGSSRRVICVRILKISDIYILFYLTMQFDDDVILRLRH